MKRALVALLLVCGGLHGCAAAIIGGGGSKSQCEQRDSRDCPKKVSRWM
ncbi:MAG TPA: hypothetical protein VNQ32_03775 [Steroidobacteraceae bacterium]|nr:hypothetical protein [Steroidobacteraceae bacterium]